MAKKRRKNVLFVQRLVKTMASCPACGDRLRVDQEEPESHEFDTDTSLVGARFPPRVYLMRVQHYLCEKCGTTVDMVVSRTTYSNPQTEQFVK